MYAIRVLTLLCLLVIASFAQATIGAVAPLRLEPGAATVPAGLEVKVGEGTVTHPSGAEAFYTQAGGATRAASNVESPTGFEVRFVAEAGQEGSVYVVHIRDVNHKLVPTLVCSVESQGLRVLKLINVQVRLGRELVSENSLVRFDGGGAITPTLQVFFVLSVASPVKGFEVVLLKNDASIEKLGVIISAVYTNGPAAHGDPPERE